MGQIYFFPLFQKGDIGFALQTFAEVRLIEPTVISDFQDQIDVVGPDKLKIPVKSSRVNEIICFVINEN